MLAVGLYTVFAARAATQYPSSRNVYQWPFSKYSIWNMPIGSGAQYVPAQLPEYPEFVAETNFNSTDSADPVTDILLLDTNGGGVNKIRSGHVSTELAQYVETTEHISGNKCGGILNSDKKTLVQGQPMFFEGGTPKYYFEWTNDINGWTGSPVSITGPGIVGCQGGSGLSAVGGSIREGELSGDEPIRHALKLVVFCHEVCSQYQNKGYRWPAIKADDYWQHGQNSWCPQCGDNSYQGKVEAMTMGSLVALRPDEDISGITDPMARKVAQALKDYGAYIVDDSATTKYHIGVEALAVKNDLGGDSYFESHDQFRQALISLMPKLHVVTNNSPSSVGGGGDPRTCYAPDFTGGIVDEIGANPNGTVAEPVGCSGGTTPPPPTPPTPTPPSTGVKPADLNGDARVDFLDLTLLMKSWKQANATKQMGDLDASGMVDILDLSILIEQWGI